MRLSVWLAQLALREADLSKVPELDRDHAYVRCPACDQVIRIDRLTLLYEHSVTCDGILDSRR